VPETEAISIEDFQSENWEQFAAFESAAEEGLTKIVRELSPEFHTYIRNTVLKALISSGPFFDEKHLSMFKVRLVIDANIIVQDSFRVAKGKFSSTDRILSSPYLELLAPDVIEEEVMRKIHENLPKGASLEIALAHAKKLLTRVRKYASISSEAVKYASTLIKQHSPEDIPYLALAIEHGADGIVSRDKKAFELQKEIKRWELHDAVVTSVTYESGAFSFFVFGSTPKIVEKTLENLLIALLDGLENALKICVSLFTAIAEKSIEVLSKIPEWAWVIIVGTGIIVILGSIFCQNFRDCLAGVALNISSTLGALVNNVIKIGKNLWGAFKNILILIWNLMPAIVVMMLIIAGVLCRRVGQLLTREMMRIIEKDISGKDSKEIGV